MERRFLRPALERLRRRHREISVGALLAAPHAAAQLVQLGEAEAVGAVDDQRIDPRHVEARLDDGGRQQKFVAPVVERRHGFFEAFAGHAPMRDDDADVGDDAADFRRRSLKVLDPRTYAENLPAAVAFAQDRLAQGRRVPGEDEGPHRETVDGRRRDQAQAAHARERHL